jgi:hypothetical protein
MELLVSTNRLQLNGNVQGNSNESNTLLLYNGCFNSSISKSYCATNIRAAANATTVYSNICFNCFKLAIKRQTKRL